MRAHPIVNSYWSELPPLFVATLAAALLAAACGDSGASPGGGASDGATTSQEGGEGDEALEGAEKEGGENEGQEGDVGPEGLEGGAGILTPPLCSCDSDCNPGNVCDAATGQCNPAAQSCTSQDFECGNIDLYRCDLADSTCKAIRFVGEPCCLDAECGGGGTSNKCRGGMCSSPCGAVVCPKGFNCASDGFCEPRSTVPPSGKCNDDPADAAHKCAAPLKCATSVTVNALPGTKPTPPVKWGVCADFCESDQECLEDSYCDRAFGRCIPKCNYDELTNQDSCPIDKACHAIGKCGPPCAADADCEKDEYKPLPTAKVKCEVETGRCRIDGCVDDRECPFPGYCEKTTFKCETGCRDFTDCNSELACIDNGKPFPAEADDCQNPPCQCVPKPCTVRGANLACGIYNFCCGENPKVACTDLTGTTIDDGQCFEPDPNVWCKPCDPNDSNSCPGPDYMRVTQDGQEQNVCFELQDQQGNPKGNYCGHVCEEDVDCPRGMKCTEIKDDKDQVLGKVCNPNSCVVWNPQTTAPPATTGP